MEELIEKIDKKLDRLQQDITDIKVDTAKNTASLEHHIKRTDELQDLYEHVHKTVEELEKDNVRVRMIWKVVAGISVLVGIAGTIIKTMHLL